MSDKVKQVLHRLLRIFDDDTAYDLEAMLLFKDIVINGEVTTEDIWEVLKLYGDSDDILRRFPKSEKSAVEYRKLCEMAGLSEDEFNALYYYAYNIILEAAQYWRFGNKRWSKKSHRLVEIRKED